jgi:hypothetical protein
MQLDERIRDQDLVRRVGPIGRLLLRLSARRNQQQHDP